MSNKPLKLIPKGQTLETPGMKVQDRASGGRLPPRKKRLAGRPGAAGEKTAPVASGGGDAPGKRGGFWSRLALGAGLAAICAAYVAGLNQPATAVVAKKRELPIYSVEREDPVLSISFDASWGADKTLSILDILDRYDVKTTFFLVGGWVDRYPDMVKELAARGHEIGNHSDTHPQMSKLSEQEIRSELQRMSDKVEKLTGTRPTLFRPPYGDYNDRVVQVARAEGYEVVQWSVDSLDWKDRGTQDIIKRCTYKVENGDVVLFHNDSKDIVNALPTIIQHYQGLGFTILPVSRLLLDGETSIDVQGKQHPVITTQPTQD